MPRSLPADSGANIRTEPAALKAGRERAKRQRRREAVKRVRAFQRWCKRGSPMGAGQVPPIPSNADFRIARGERG